MGLLGASQVRPLRLEAGSSSLASLGSRPSQRLRVVRLLASLVCLLVVDSALLGRVLGLPPLEA